MAADPGRRRALGLGVRAAVAVVTVPVLGRLLLQDGGGSGAPGSPAGGGADPGSVTPTPTLAPPETVPVDLAPPLPEGEGDGGEGAAPVPAPLPGFTGGGRVAGDAGIARTDLGWELPVLVAGSVAQRAAREGALAARAVADRMAIDAAFINADAAELATQADLAFGRSRRAQRRLRRNRADLADAIARIRDAGAAAYTGLDDVAVTDVDALLTGGDPAGTARGRTYVRSGLAELEDRRRRAVDRAVAAGTYRTRTAVEAAQAALVAAEARRRAEQALADAGLADLYARLLEGRADGRPVAGDLSELTVLATADRLAFPFAGRFEFWDTWGACRDACTRQHKGTDVIGERDIPLVALEDGFVRLTQNRLGGTCVWLEGRSGNRYYYAHLSAWAEGLVDGAVVLAGQVLGYNGDTGNAQASVPHLHFEVHPSGGGAVNPYPLLKALAESDAAARAAGLRPVPPAPPTGPDGGPPVASGPPAAPGATAGGG